MRQGARDAVTGLGWLALTAAVFDLVARDLVRRGLFGGIGTNDMEPTVLLAAASGAWLIAYARPVRLRVFAAFLLAFAVGAACQMHLGARLQSDGFYYYAYLRSLWFDHDVNFLNDYRILGLTDKSYLFAPTSTGHAPSAWTIGPAIVWSPFFAVGHVVASALRRIGVAADGTSFPYRQAICLAGLFYGLLGVYFCARITAHVAPRRIAAAAAVLTISGSFLLWYLICEPSMTHAPSMAAVAAFVWVWIATLRRRTLWQWVALGALGGLMALIRWQNVIYGWLPVCEVVALIVAQARRHDWSELRALVVGSAAGSIAALAAFLPQMLAWKAIYGGYISVSPLGPQIRLWDPHLVDILWSSRNGLFAFSPVLYVGALGLLVLVARHRLIGVAFASAFLLMVYFNSTVQDWWGSDGFGGRRFDGAVVLIAAGVAMALDVGRRWIARTPAWPAIAVCGAALVWNTTFRVSASRGVFDGSRPADFGEVAADQASTLHRWIGHPPSYPVNLLFGAANEMPPAAYDLMAPVRFFSDPARPYGRVDVGAEGDTLLVGDGFFAPEREGPIDFRWASGRAALRVPLSRTARLRVQLRLRAYAYAGAPAQHATVRINAHTYGPFDVAPEWQTITFVADRPAWRTTVNHVVLEFARADAPADHGGGDDRRALAAAVDYLRVAVEP